MTKASRDGLQSTESTTLEQDVIRPGSGLRSPLIRSGQESPSHRACRGIRKLGSDLMLAQTRAAHPLGSVAPLAVAAEASENWVATQFSIDHWISNMLLWSFRSQHVLLRPRRADLTRRGVVAGRSSAPKSLLKVSHSMVSAWHRSRIQLALDLPVRNQVLAERFEEPPNEPVWTSVPFHCS